MTDTSSWFFRTRDQFPFWKKLIWLTFGKKRVGEKHGCKVTGYEFREITMVWRIESEDEFWRYP